jgi:hypothetical protein
MKKHVSDSQYHLQAFKVITDAAPYLSSKIKEQYKILKLSLPLNTIPRLENLSIGRLLENEVCSSSYREIDLIYRGLGYIGAIDEETGEYSPSEASKIDDIDVNFFRICEKNIVNQIKLFAAEPLVSDRRDYANDRLFCYDIGLMIYGYIHHPEYYRDKIQCFDLQQFYDYNQSNIEDKTSVSRAIKISKFTKYLKQAGKVKLSIDKHLVDKLSDIEIDYLINHGFTLINNPRFNHEVQL